MIFFLLISFFSLCSIFSFSFLIFFLFYFYFLFFWSFYLFLFLYLLISFSFNCLFFLPSLFISFLFLKPFSPFRENETKNDRRKYFPKKFILIQLSLNFNYLINQITKSKQDTQKIINLSLYLTLKKKSVLYKE